MTNEERMKLQKDALLALAQDHNIVVNWGTGVGKSRVAVRAFNALERKGKSRFLLLVAESAHKDNWRDEFIKGLGKERAEQLLSKITIKCYASLLKYENSEWDLIVADEAHHLRSENRTSIICTMKTDYFACLSATLSDRGDADNLLESLEDTFGPFTWKKFGLQDAIDNNILSEPEIFVHMLPLNETEKDKVVVISWGVPWYRKKLCKSVEQLRNAWKEIYSNPKVYPDLELTITECSDKQMNFFLDAQIDIRKQVMEDAYKNYYDELRRVHGNESDSTVKTLKKQAETFKFQYLQAGLQRKKFFGEYKTPFAKKLLEDLGDKKYICFCSDIEQGESLMADNIIHSKRKKKENEKIINAFNNSDINSIFAVGMIKEGQNLAGIQAGVIIQLSGKEREFIQEFGRAMRSEKPEQHIIVVDKTHDLDYLANALGNINMEYVKYRVY